MAQSTEATATLESTARVATTSATPTRSRVQIDFSAEAYKRLQEVKTLSGDQSNAEVIRNAIRLYEWYLEKKAENFEFLLAKGDEVRRVEVLL